MVLAAHVQKIAPRLRHALRPQQAPPAAAWCLTVDDPVAGAVRLSGRFTGLDEAWGWAPGTPRRAVLVVHGLGGSSDSVYARRAAATAAAEGLASLRIDLRGSDRRGEDYYHAGLSGDLHAALASPELAGFDELYAVGYSLGGHIVLRMATESADPRLKAVAAVCPPLALAVSAEHIDRRSSAVYRTYLLGGMKDIYAEVAARRDVPCPLPEARRIRFLREWDERVVAPRHGFAGVDDYYQRASVAPRIGELKVPALIVGSDDDPMVPAAAVRPFLAEGDPMLTFRWLATGGHLGAYRTVDLGLGFHPGLGLERQLYRWLVFSRGGCSGPPSPQERGPAGSPPPESAPPAPHTRP